MWGKLTKDTPRKKPPPFPGRGNLSAMLIPTIPPPIDCRLSTWENNFRILKTMEGERRKWTSGFDWIDRHEEQMWMMDSPKWKEIQRRFWRDWAERCAQEKREAAKLAEEFDELARLSEEEHKQWIAQHFPERVAADLASRR
jgi:hypothetical protein